MRPWTWITIRIVDDHLRAAPKVHEQVIAVLEGKVVRWALRLHLEGRFDLSPVLEQIEQEQKDDL